MTAQTQSHVPTQVAGHMVLQPLLVRPAERAAIKQQRAMCVWFTGLSGAGKSTLANLLEKQLHADGKHTYMLDGDNVRHALSRDLGFSDADRIENIRRAAEVARLMVDAGLIVLVSFISPFAAQRALARSLFEPGEFLEVFVDTPFEECARRDVKGLYSRALSWQIPGFTGVGSTYEAPSAPDLHLRPMVESVDQCVAQLMKATTRPSGLRLGLG